MPTDSVPTTAWRARGLLFENCSCQLVCPGHVHFEQLCTHDRCRGYWAVRIDDGAFGAVSLAGAKAIVAFDTPQKMITGGWTEVIIVDSAATPEQRRAVEMILNGSAGGPWAVLARFVERRLESRALPIVFDTDGAIKRAMVPGVLETMVTPIRGRDRAKPVSFENIFNQIHAPTQVLATGDTTYDDGVIVVKNERTHGLYSNFEWIVGT
jgi:hypothetical protein